MGKKHSLRSPSFTWVGLTKKLQDRERKVVTIWRLTECSRHTESTSPGIWQLETQQPFPPEYPPCRKGQRPNEEKVWDEKDGMRKTSLGL